MFLTNNYNKKILFYDKKSLLKVRGDFKTIEKYIKSKHKKNIIGENTFLNHYSIGSSINLKKDLLIYDSRRQVNILIKKELHDEYSLWYILDILYFFYKAEKINIIKFKTYGNLPIYKKNIIIKNIKQLVELGLGSPNFQEKNGYYVCNYFFSYGLGNYKNNEEIVNNARGVAKTKKIAKEKAISEIIERVSASFDAGIYGLPKKGKYVYKNYISKKEFSEKKREGKYVEIKKIGPSYKNKFYCPNEIIYYPVPYYFNSCISNSNGMATHIRLGKAKKGALVELIERDSFILSWLLKSGIYKISIKSYINIKRIIEKIKKEYQAQIFTYTIKFDSPIPVIAMIMTKDKKTIIVTGCGTTFKSALEKTAQELIGMSEFLKTDPSSLRDNPVMDHIAHYLKPKNYKDIEWLINLPKIDQDIVDGLYNEIEKPGFDNIIKYYNKIGIGFFQYQYKNKLNTLYRRYTMRIISDTLLPIYFGKDIPQQIIDSKRLLVRKKSLNIKKINIDLQPFG